MNFGRAMVLPMLLMGFLIAGYGASEEQMNSAFDKAIKNVEIELSETQIQNPFLFGVLHQSSKAMALFLTALIYFGAYLYTVFPLPEILFLPLTIIIMLDAITIGFFGNLAIKSLFSGILFGVEKTGLVNWGEKI